MQAVIQDIGTLSSLNDKTIAELDAIVLSSANQLELNDSSLAALGVTSTKPVDTIDKRGVTINYKLTTNAKLDGAKTTYLLQIFVKKDNHTNTLNVTITSSDAYHTSDPVLEDLASQLGAGSSLDEVDYEILDRIVSDTTTKRSLTDLILSSMGVSFNKKISELTLNGATIDYQLLGGDKVVGEIPSYTLFVILTRGEFSKNIEVLIKSISPYEGIATEILPILKSLHSIVVDFDFSVINSESTFLSNYDNLNLPSSWRGVALSYEFISNENNLFLKLRVIGSLNNIRKFYEITIYSRLVSEMLRVSDSLSGQVSNYDLSSLNADNFDTNKNSLGINLPQIVDGISMKYSYGYYNAKAQTLLVNVEMEKEGITYSRNGGITVYSTDHSAVINAFGRPLENIVTEYDFSSDDSSNFDISKYNLNFPTTVGNLTFTYTFLHNYNHYISVSLNSLINGKTISISLEIFKKSYTDYREFINSISNIVVDTDFSTLTSENFDSMLPTLGLNLPASSGGFTYTYAFSSLEQQKFLWLRVNGTNGTDSFNNNQIHIYSKTIS